MSLTAVWDSSPYDSEERAKTKGMRVSASAHHTDLRLAREIAKELARDGAPVWADLVRRKLTERHPDITGPFNFMGSVFKGKEWVFMGYVKSQTLGSHRNRLCVWTLRA